MEPDDAANIFVSEKLPHQRIEKSCVTKIAGLLRWGNIVSQEGEGKGRYYVPSVPRRRRHLEKEGGGAPVDGFDQLATLPDCVRCGVLEPSPSRLDE